ncbi:unnamed protein product [Notodromas monacha]|uniref:BBSome-interacting protein 1 n=1 Tax=Notodromas monacha TaxID=399045 RepID=A0A7R9GE63_9CRUS|nr:unnamed protein product [Notodromas monacha]CAG0919284.1 unnamed protein product [Notodromas monacha]
MSESDARREILPKKGLVYFEDEPRFVFCKPKLMPLKSVTLEKLDQMQAAARQQVKDRNVAQDLGSDNKE